MTPRLSHIHRSYCWPNGGSLGPDRDAMSKIGWHFWCDRTKVGEDYASNRKFYMFSSFWEACLAQAVIRAELQCIGLA